MLTMHALARISTFSPRVNMAATYRSQLALRALSVSVLKEGKLSHKHEHRMIQHDDSFVRFKSTVSFASANDTAEFFRNAYNVSETLLYVLHVLLLFINSSSSY